MKPVFLLIVLGVSAISSEEMDFNTLVDENISRIGDMMRKMNWLNRGIELPGYANLADKYSFPRITILGLGYLRRTGDCKLIKEKTMWNYKLNLGSSFLVLVIPRLMYNDEEMSAVLRVKNNSMYISFDQTKGSNNLIVNDLAVTSLGQVEFWSSSPKYEGADVDGIFDNIRKLLNNLLNNEKESWNPAGTEIWNKFTELYPDGIFKEL